MLVREFNRRATMIEPQTPTESEPIHVALKADDVTKKRAAIPYRTGLFIAPLIAPMLMLLLITRFFINTGRALPTVVQVLGAIMFFVGIAVSLWWPVRAGIPQKSKRSWQVEPAEKSDPAQRLRVFGKKSHMAFVLDSLDSSRISDPVALRMWTPDQAGFVNPRPVGIYDKQVPIKEPANKAVIFFGLMIFIAAYFLAWILESPGFKPTWRSFPFGYFEIMGCLGVAVISCGWMMPRYVRISPGRLDVMQFGALGFGRRFCHRYDLKRAKIAISVSSRVAVIEDDTNKERPIVVFQWNTRGVDGRTIPALLLDAARSPYTAPELPADRLVG